MNGSPTEEKSAVRREMRMRRKALPPERRASVSSAICRKLIRDVRIAAATAPDRSGGALAVYFASPDEIDLTLLVTAMLERGVTVVSPRWNGETYELAKVKSLLGRDIRIGPMNIPEPLEADIVHPRDVGAWIVPGLAFTSGGKRLGYGGGWYDRLLAESRKDSLKIGVAHEFQLLPDLPGEPHDIPLDRVVTAH